MAIPTGTPRTNVSCPEIRISKQEFGHNAVVTKAVFHVTQELAREAAQSQSNSV